VKALSCPRMSLIASLAYALFGYRNSDILLLISFENSRESLVESETNNGEIGRRDRASIARIYIGVLE